MNMNTLIGVIGPTLTPLGSRLVKRYPNLPDSGTEIRVPFLGDWEVCAFIGGVGEVVVELRDVSRTGPGTVAVESTGENPDAWEVDTVFRRVVSMLAGAHEHYFSATHADMWCADCGNNADYCAAEVSRNVTR